MAHKSLDIVLGVGTLFYGLVSITELFVAGHLSGVLEERRQQRMIDSLSDHHVVDDDNPDSHELAQAVGLGFIEVPPSDGEVLRDAGRGEGSVCGAGAA